MFNRIAQFFTSSNTSLFFIGLMFCYPFTIAYHHIPIAAFTGEWLAAAFGVIAMFGMLNKNFWQNFKLPQISLVFIGLAAIVCMQLMLSMLHSPKYALLVLSYIAWAFLLVVLGSYLRRTLGWEKLAINLAWLLVLGGIINVVYVAMQIAMKLGVAIPLMPKFQMYGALAQQNNFADYIALATASLMYLYAKKQLQLKWFAVGLVLFITLLAFSASRSTWLYLGFITLLSIGLQVKSIKQQTGSPNNRSLVRVGLILLPLFAIIQLVLHNALPDALIILPTERLNASMDGTASLRAQFWQTSWYLFTQNPWLGIGAGQMRWQAFMLIDSSTLNPSQMVFEHSHNLFIHLLTEMGIGAALLALIGLGSWAWAFKWRELNLETWWLIALLGVIGIHSMLEYPLWYTYFLGVFAFLLGVGEEKITHIKFNKIPFKALQVGFFGVILIAMFNLTTSAIAYAKLEKWMSKPIAQQVKAKYDRDEFFNDFTWIRQYSVLAPYAELIFLNSVTPEKNQVKDLIALSESVMRFSPSQNMTYQHALLLKLNGDEVEAVKQLNRALIAYPKGLNASIERQPMKYWQHYLDMLSIARPIKKSNKAEKMQLNQAK